MEKIAWTPPPLPFSDDMLAPVRIGFADSTLRNMAKAAKGRWDPEKRLWFIVFGKIKGTELEKHIVLDANPVMFKQ